MIEKVVLFLMFLVFAGFSACEQINFPIDKETDSFSIVTGKNVDPVIDSIAIDYVQENAKFNLYISPNKIDSLDHVELWFTIDNIELRHVNIPAEKFKDLDLKIKSFGCDNLLNTCLVVHKHNDIDTVCVTINPKSFSQNCQ